MFSIEEENFKLFFRHVKAGNRKIITLISRANHYIIHDMFTIITFNPENFSNFAD